MELLLIIIICILAPPVGACLVGILFMLWLYQWLDDNDYIAIFLTVIISLSFLIGTSLVIWSN